MQRLPLWRTMKNAYGAPSSKIICFVWPFFQSSLQHHRFCFGNPPVYPGNHSLSDSRQHHHDLPDIPPYGTIPQSSDWLEHHYYKIHQRQTGLAFPHKQAEEIELAVKCAKEEHDNPEHSENTAAGGICTTLDDRTIRLRNFFSGTSQVSKIYYKLWMAKKANRLPLIVLTSFRILVSSFFIVTVVHKFLTENPKVTFLLLLLTIFRYRGPAGCLTNTLK